MHPEWKGVPGRRGAGRLCGDANPDHHTNIDTDREPHTASACSIGGGKVKRLLLSLLLCVATASAQERIRPHIDAWAPTAGTPASVPRRAPTDSELNAAIAAASAEFDIPFEVIEAVIYRESMFDLAAIRYEPWLDRRNPELDAGQASSWGLMQVMGWHAGKAPCAFVHQPIELVDITNNIRCGTAILAQARSEHGGDIRRALIAYNASHDCAVTECRWGVKYATAVLAMAKRLAARPSNAPELK